MKNRIFTQMSAAEKRKILTTVLRNTSNGVLDDGMIGRILPIVSIHKQYTVAAFSNKKAFHEAVARTQTGKGQLSVISSRNGYGRTIAVVTPLRATGPKKHRRAIFIYAPDQYYKKGAEQWAGTPKKGLCSRF